MKKKLILVVVLLLLSRLANAEVVSGGGLPCGASILVVSGTACPSGYVEETALRGFMLMGTASGQTSGNSVGTAQTGASPVAPAISCTATSNFVTTAGIEPACDNSPVPTIATPIKYVMGCKKC